MTGPPIQKAFDASSEPGTDRYFRPFARDPAQRRVVRGRGIALPKAARPFAGQPGRVGASGLAFDATDLFSAEPLRYHVREDGSFLLCSVGPDQQDDKAKLERLLRARDDFVYWPPTSPRSAKDG